MEVEAVHVDGLAMAFTNGHLTSRLGGDLMKTGRQGGSAEQLRHEQHRWAEAWHEPRRFGRNGARTRKIAASAGHVGENGPRFNKLDETATVELHALWQRRTA